MIHKGSALIWGFASLVLMSVGLGAFVNFFQINPDLKAVGSLVLGIAVFILGSGILYNLRSELFSGGKDE